MFTQADDPILGPKAWEGRVVRCLSHLHQVVLSWSVGRWWKRKGAYSYGGKVPGIKEDKLLIGQGSNSNLIAGIELFALLVVLRALNRKTPIPVANHWRFVIGSGATWAIKQGGLRQDPSSC